MHRVVAWTLLIGCLAGPDVEGGDELFQFQGAAESDLFGDQVAGVGDVSGDGVPDFLVGAPQQWFLFGSGGVGYARLISGADGSVLDTKTGQLEGDRFGAAVDGGADLDGDGRSDYLVGADQSGWFLSAGTGYVQVFSGQTGSLLLPLAGDEIGDRFGASAAFAGDVNQDGNVDIIVGAPGSSVGGVQAGIARVYSGMDGSTLFTKSGSGASTLFGAGDELGRTVAAAGDVDGDGYDDVIVGTGSVWIFSDGVGNRAMVYSGMTGNLIHSFVGSGYDAFGSAVSGGGDLDVDGHPDLVIGAPLGQDDSVIEGGAYAYSGASGELLLALEGDFVTLGFGGDVAGLLDVNGNGHDEVVVTSANDDLMLKGMVRVFDGDEGAPIATWLFEGDDLFGAKGSLSPAGDVDGDGVGDLVIGTQRVHDLGEAFVWSPKLAQSAPMPSYSFTAGDELNGDIGSASDVDEIQFFSAKSGGITLEFAEVSGSFSPKVSLHAVTDGEFGSALKSWSDVNEGEILTLSPSKAGMYGVRIVGADDSTGSYRVFTNVEFPKGGEPKTKLVKFKKKKGVVKGTAKLKAIAGTQLNLSVVLLSGGTPSVKIYRPSGMLVAPEEYDAELVGSTLELTNLELDETGKYRIEFYGGEKKQKAEVEFLPGASSGLSLEME